jgi:hypothetical protein
MFGESFRRWRAAQSGEVQMNEVNREFSAKVENGFSAVSADELVRLDGGILPLVYGIAFGVGMIAGYVGTKKAMGQECTCK